MNLPQVFLATSRPARSGRLVRLAATAVLLGGAAFGALAQYKIVGPDGRVTYTDKPPTASDIRVGGDTAGSSQPASTGGLPYETRQAMASYPVTLYSSANCPACDAVRNWLKGHAIPFSEYTAATESDYAALQTRVGGNSLPVTTIGPQKLLAFNAADLQSYLDAAGYPKQARLTGYAWPAPRPLTAPSRTPAANAGAASAAQAPALPPPSQSGIQF